MKNKKNLSKLVITLLICFMQFTGFSQVKTVTGKVTEQDGEPLTGVTIIIKGTTRGISTDIDGNYEIPVENEDAVLVFSFVGYITQEIPVSDQTTINVVLREDIMELEEIVVMGYGTTKKSDLTGSLASLKEDDFNTGVITSPEQMIQGRVPGVQITSNNGEPGAGSSIVIRGRSSIRTSQMPLYVIDGVPLDITTSSPDAIAAQGFGDGSATNPLNFINPNDIESIDILKDASAAAIYGARGANGVIIITTKKGTEGRSEINYSAYLGISELPKKIDVLSAEEFVFWRDSLWDVGEDDPSHYGYETDWQDEIFRKGISHNHNLSVSGGSANNSYRASFNYFNQEGIIKNSNLTRYTGKINVTQKAFKDRLYFEANITGSQIDEDRLPIGSRTGFEGDLIINALQANPTWPVYDSTGVPFQVNQQNKRNPIAMLEYTEDKTKTNRILASISGELEIIKGLDYKINFGIDNSVAVRRINQSQKLNYMVSDMGRGDINNRELTTYLVEHTLTYSNTFAGIHRINALAGFSYQHFLIRGYNIITRGYESDEVLYTNNLQASSTDLSEPSSYALINEMQSFFGRVNYNLLEKLLITATLRRDGSSKFGENVKYGNFPSFAVAWRISQHDFIKDLNVFNNLKLRLGWGQTGNQEIGSKHSLFALSAQDNAKAVLDASTITQGYVLTKTPTPDVTWETTTSTNIGLDFGFFRGRLSGTADYFIRRTFDALLEVPAKQPAPTQNQLINIEEGYIENKGIELGINGVVVSTSDINWDVNVNFTKINNVVKDLPVTRIATGSASGQGFTGVLVQVYTNDEPMNTFYGYKHLGFDTADGRSIYVEGASGLDTLLLLGSPLPDFIWSVNTSFRYRNFDFSLFLEAVNGNLIYNNTANSIGVMGNLYQANNTFPSTVETIESRRNSMRFSDRFLEDGSFVRLSNVTIGYNLPLSKIPWISNLRLYASGSNLFVITDYTGYDPDVTNTPGKFDAYNSIGIDNSSYPKSRTYLFGLNITF
jgi:TonB-linked SusC/RagA family outer membrane protein